jgi:hypothetical protein
VTRRASTSPQIARLDPGAPAHRAQRSTPSRILRLEISSPVWEKNRNSRSIAHGETMHTVLIEQAP